MFCLLGGLAGDLTTCPKRAKTEHYCPRCKRCDCERRAAREKRCSNCTLMIRAELLEDGLCPDCRRSAPADRSWGGRGLQNTW